MNMQYGVGLMDSFWENVFGSLVMGCVVVISR